MSNEIEVDVGSGKDEPVVQTNGCRVCKKEWPDTTFRKYGEFAARDTDWSGLPEPVCDLCWNRSSAEIDQAIDEAQQPKGVHLERRVVVTGIKSGTNLTQFEYVTHRGMEPLIMSDVTVHFRKNPEAPESPRTTYIFRQVPVAILEAWFVAPSKGGFFIQWIKNSYSAEKVK